MSKECENLPNCGFFIKYCKTKDLACKGFISMYCKGDKMEECKRLQYKREHGTPPSDDMMPSGQMLKN
jgi:hypothetical protein